MLAGTSNQSDYLSHFIANHMFLRLSLAGSRRVVLDHVEFCRQHLPSWNPLSVIGQHTQQAGATPAEAMGSAMNRVSESLSACCPPWVSGSR